MICERWHSFPLRTLYWMLQKVFFCEGSSKDMNHRGPSEQDPSTSHAANANAIPSNGEIRIDVSDANEGADRVGDLPRLSRNTSRRFSSEYTNGHGPPTLYKVWCSACQSPCQI